MHHPSVIVDPSASLMASLLTGFDNSDATGIDITRRFANALRGSIALFHLSPNF
ncbi:hypothetical protein QUA40_02810 [Microcoleus sp. Pol11C3]|uniref:hypothetical protein n=1 Tax=Microcoleus sp. Pol11C3 TaxID=3055390 RepID=UPI002FCF775C